MGETRPIKQKNIIFEGHMVKPATEIRIVQSTIFITSTLTLILYYQLFMEGKLNAHTGDWQGVAAVALFAVGATLSLFTGRNAVLSGLRMLAIGAAAGGVTYMVGRMLGVSVN